MLLHIVYDLPRTFGNLFSKKGATIAIAAISTKEVNVDAISAEVLTVQERVEAVNVFVRFAQREAFAEELRDLKERKQVRKRSVLNRLTPFLDEKEII